MKKISAVAALVAFAAVTSSAFASVPAKGEAVFKEKCMACHPDGGNIMNPQKSIKGLKDTKSIVRKVRSGGNGMTAFDAKAISDADAKAVAEYIVKTFKK